VERLYCVWLDDKSLAKGQGAICIAVDRRNGALHIDVARFAANAGCACSLAWIASSLRSLAMTEFQASNAYEAARRQRRQRLIDCMEAIMRERNLNSRTTTKWSPPKAVRFAHP
jgi:hypothetical protein